MVNLFLGGKGAHSHFLYYWWPQALHTRNKFKVRLDVFRKTLKRGERG